MSSNNHSSDSYNAIKTIFLQPEFENFVSTYMSNVFTTPEQPQIHQQEPSYQRSHQHFYESNLLCFEEHPTQQSATLEYTPCVCCDLSNLKVNTSETERPVSYSSSEEPMFRYSQSHIPSATTDDYFNKLQPQPKDYPLHRSLPELPILPQDSFSQSPSPASAFSDSSPLLSPSRTPSPPPRQNLAFNPRTVSMPSSSAFEAAFASANSSIMLGSSMQYSQKGNCYFSAPSSATNSPTKPGKAPVPYSTLPNTEILLERTPQRKVIWTPALHEHFLSALAELDPTGEGIAKPRDIVDRMGVPGLTRANISSHLQKYKLKTKQKHSISHSFRRK